MHDTLGRHPSTLVTLDSDLEQEFEERLRDSQDLAVRVAYGIVRHRQDAEEIAQEAFVKAYRSFSALRNRSAFRSWLV